MTGRHIPTIAISGVNFGWGSAGKIASIVAALTEPFNLVLVNTSLGRPILRGINVAAEIPDCPTGPAQLEQLLGELCVDAALVVLDPLVATSIEEAGTPVVYVDSLPFLWSAADPIPTDVTHYLAQRLPGSSPAVPHALRTVRNLDWIDPIAAAVSGRSSPNPDLAVINLGGLHSPANPSGNPVYCDRVLPVLFETLRRTRYRRVMIVGNLSREQLPAVPSGIRLVHVGALPHQEFLRVIAGAGVLVTSPGLTTILEAAAAGTPTICLPSQNVSQLLNGDYFAAMNDGVLRVEWPHEVLDRTLVEAARPEGEEAALAVIDRSLRQTTPHTVHESLRQPLLNAFAGSSMPGMHRPAQHWNGAAQVADRLLALARRSAAVLRADTA
jgi:hydroxymethylcytosylglucuronate/cytosylglucuronate synthase